MINEMSASNEYYVVDIYTPFFHHCYGVDSGDPSHLFPDYVYRPILTDFDIHPITAGQEKIYELVYAKLLLLK